MKNRWYFSAMLAGLLFCAPAMANYVQSLNLTVTIDEFGNGINTVGRGVLAADPGPGGLSSALTYTLPFTAVQGDIFLVESAFQLSDVLRFNGNGTVVFYSDGTDGLDAPADTLSPPTSFYANVAAFFESGSEGNNGFVYTPNPGQPGYTPDFAVTYRFVSDGVVPSPSSAALGFLGLPLGIGAACLRRKMCVA